MCREEGVSLTPADDSTGLQQLVRAVSLAHVEEGPPLSFSAKLAMVFGDTLLRPGFPSPSSLSSRRPTPQEAPKPLPEWSSSRGHTSSRVSHLIEPRSSEARVWKMDWMLHFLPEPTGDLASLLQAIDELPAKELSLQWRLDRRSGL